MTILRHILSILLLPATVALFVPYWILSARSLYPPSLAAALLGAGVILCGLALVAVTIRQFATLGQGTLAPWDPPRHLVVAGVYRHVRNPMISGVILILFGEAPAFLSRGLLEWALGFLAVSLTYIPLLEEPMLEGRFGDEYRQYKRYVPRWTAWTPLVSR